ncbi:hypothetical protein MTR_2g028210 [Medicago truncatula]|uniref:Uncharacterized protein n=1 Tax=Medicago truncatula TaxID=3880 RepID=G7ISS0_MEDTR|nr:hypothetical protein MTR_2g028210 [Medicago truncatula]
MLNAPVTYTHHRGNLVGVDSRRRWWTRFLQCEFTKWQSHNKLTHTSGDTGVRTPVMASGLTMSAFYQLS